VVDKYVSDPMCGFIPSAGLFRDMMGGLRFIGADKNLSRMNKDLPVYFFSGSADPVGEKGKGVTRVYRSFINAGMTDVTLKLYPEGRHEMLNELNRDAVYADVLGWIESKIG
jgi:alpha-beta hydrolase superfamily lysophospholipase